MRKTKLAEKSSYKRRVRQTRLLTTGKCFGEDGDLLEYLLHVCHCRLHFPLLDTFLPKVSVLRPWSDNQAFICTTLLLEMLKAYDKIQNQMLLEAAIRLADWLKQVDETDVALINLLQCYYRKREV